MSRNYLTVHKVEKIEINESFTLLLQFLPQFQSTAIGLFIDKGSRSESKEQEGLMHFTEHMLFKGSKKYTKEQISTFFDQTGGLVDAFTSKEELAIINRIPTNSLNENIDLIFEILFNSKFDENEFTQEKKVILNELYDDIEDPVETLTDNFYRKIFDRDLGHPTIGNEKILKETNNNKLFQFYKEKINSSMITLSIAGNFDKENLLSVIKQLDINNKIFNESTVQRQKSTGHFHIDHSTDQLHIITGRTNLEFNDTQKIQLRLFNLIFGESMSSRLFSIIRDNLGLCYNIYSDFEFYKYESLFEIYLSIMPDTFQKTTHAIQDIIKDLKINGITEKELENAKKQAISEIILSQDELVKIVSQNYELNVKFNENFTTSDIIDMYSKTTKNDIDTMINYIFDKDTFLTGTLYNKEIKFNGWQF